MAEKRPNVVLVPPGGIGRAEALRRLVKPGSWITSLDDGALAGAKRQLGDQLDEVEIIPFGSALARFAGMFGDSGGARLTATQMRAILARVAENLPEEAHLSIASQFPGAAAAVCEAITELHYHRISCEDLKFAGERAGSNSARVFSELAQLEADVRAISQEFGKEFGVDRATFCLEQREYRKLPVEHLIVLPSTEYAPIYADWIRWIARNGVKVDVIVESLGAGSPTLFVEQQKLMEALTGRVAGSLDDDVWVQALFSNTIAAEHPEVTILDAGDPLAESEAAVRRILALLRSGTTESEVGLFVRDVDTYVPLLVSAARRLGLRVAGTLAVPLLTNGFAAKTLEILKVLVSDDVRRLTRAAQSSYFAGLNSSDDYLRTVTTTAHAAEEDSWLCLRTLLEADDAAPAWAIALLDWRDDAMLSPRTLGQWCEHLRSLWDGSEVLDRIHLSESETSARDCNAMTVMQRSLRDQSLASSPSERISFSKFVEEVEKIWDLESVAWSDLKEGVRICTSTSQLGDYEHLFVLGMLEGTFPRRRREHPVLSDVHRQYLAEILPDRPALPLSHDLARIERDEFVRLCASGRTSLTFSYPLTDDDRDNVPAIFLDELSRACGQGVRRIHVPRGELVPRKEECTSVQDIAIRTALDAPRVPAEVAELKSERARERVRIDPGQGVSPRVLATAITCPFKALAGKLDVSARSDSTVLRTLAKIPEQVRLQQLEDLNEARSLLKDAIAAQIDELAPTAEAWEITLMKDASDRLVDDWIRKERKARAQWGLDPKAASGPVPFGSPQLKQDLRLEDGNIVRLSGQVSSVAQIGEITAAVIYGVAAPQFKADWNEAPEDLLRIGIYLLSLRNSDVPAVMIESHSGSRRIYLLENHSSIRTDREDHDLKQYHFSKTYGIDLRIKRNRLGKLVARYSKEAARVLSEATMRPTPGDHCQDCDLADLCRNHADYGENSLSVVWEDAR